MSKRRSFGDENGSGDRRNKRRRNDSSGDFNAESSFEDKIESLIVKIGEKSNNPLEENLKQLADVFGDDLTKYKTKLLEFFCECVVELPEKTCIYSTLVGLLNVKNYKFGGEIVELLVAHFKEYLKTCKWERARILVRFFGDLVNCHVISSGSLMSLFESLVDVTIEDNIPQTRSDFFVYSVLSALPLVGKELYEKKEQDLEQLLNTIENYISKRSKTHHTALRVWYSDTPHPQEEYLDCLWAQISKLRSDKWIEKHINRPYLNLDAYLCEALQHNLSQIQIPPHDSSYIYPCPKVVFRLFDYTDCPEAHVLPGAHSIERYLIEEQMKLIIDQNYFARKDCAIALLNIPGKQKIPLDYMLVEVILGEMFTLPQSKYLEICYGSLLLELCKLQPSTLPQVLAQAVELIFERLETMNISCVDRFASWFAYHLSNFQFSWNWDDWSTCLSTDTLHPKQKFVRETLHRCVRLSYHQRIAELLPDSFQPLLPEPPVPVNKYIDEETSTVPGVNFAKALLTCFKEKSSPEEVLAALADVPNPLQESEEGNVSIT
ncbi:nuclear cap-binding protein subunit 1-like protein [Leptotrombidium deliense]|uniref:Nuclear cap-binding protein subunit 1 n=1 Tax=Leptotrombidium deliense TaxID=299467 RepID=A0A443S4W4_9ACAR|nr:nuclear cap-binding protein subunit 1-like protein [Leptotrombidium deliense]